MNTMNQDSPQARYQALLGRVRSLQLATVDAEGRPRVSYAPFLQLDNDAYFYIFISQLSGHTRDLLNNRRTSVMLIEDETEASQLFARNRASYECNVDIVEYDQDDYDGLLDAMTERFGSIIEMLRSLPDFVLFRLRPESGRFVMGFGQAFDLGGEQMRILTPVKPGQ